MEITESGKIIIDVENQTVFFTDRGGLILFVVTLDRWNRITHACVEINYGFLHDTIMQKTKP